MNHIHTRTRCGLLMVLATAITSGCMPEDPTQCQTSDDCFVDELCRFSRCVAVYAPSSADGAHPPNTPPGEDRQLPSRPWPDMETGYGIGDPLPADADMGEDASPDAAHTEEADMEMTETPPASPCAETPARPGEVVLHEVLVSVPQGEAGDANGDGIRDAYEDEFVEILNVSTQTIDLGGVSVANGDRPKFTFEAPYCLAPMEAVLVFGGPKGTPPQRWGEVQVFFSTTRLGFSNSGGEVNLLDPEGRILFGFTYEDAADTGSYQLWPEVTGGSFQPHDVVGGLPFSPATCTHGAALDTGCAAP